MFLTGLANALAGTGLNVEEISGWKTRGRGPMIKAKSIICHHTGSAQSASNPFPTRHVLIAGRPGLIGPLCNLALDRNGKVYIVAAGRANHAGAVKRLRWSNSYAIGIEAEADGRSAWPPRQMEAYALLCKALLEHYGIPLDDVRGHKEVCFPTGRKIDPNFNMPNFRTMVEEIEVIRDADLDRIAERVSEQVWKRDFLRPPARETDPNNPTWQAQSYLCKTLDTVDELLARHAVPPAPPA